jgi:septation ring formation regulator EzrA
MALRHEKRLLQRSEVNLGREGCSQAVNFPEVRNEIVALKKLEQEQKEVAVRITQIEEGIRKIELQRAQNAKEQNEALAKLEEEKKPILERRNEARAATDLCDRELAGVERRLQDNDAIDRDLLKKLAELQSAGPSAG